MSTFAGFKTELAKSGRATCKKCSRKIGQGTLRVATGFHHPQADYVMWRWTHMRCHNFKTTTDPTEFYGWDELPANEQARLSAYIKGEPAPAAASGSNKRARDDSDDEESSEASPPPKKKKKTTKKKAPAKVESSESESDEDDEPLEDRLSALKVAELKAVCRDNGLAVGGKKADLIDRILEVAEELGDSFEL